MELNKNIIGIQGVLSQCSQKIGDFTTINYKGGNEAHINLFTSELANFLTCHNLLEHNDEELNKVLFFLAINTNFKRNLPDSDQYCHLIGIVPKLSKCLLANTCFNLNLIKNYLWLIKKLPLELTEELLDQAIDCLKHMKAKKLLSCSYNIIAAVIRKLSVTELSYQTEDVVDDIVNVATIILDNATGIIVDQVRSMKTDHVYQQMGFVLLKLYKLLLTVDLDNRTVCKLLPPVISNTCNIMRCITLDVFCSWAETEYEDQHLQIVVATSAYLVVEKYQKNKLATELITMLKSIGRKPKTITERIQEADVSTIVKMVNDAGEHQILWFRALLNVQALSDVKVVECVERWLKLGEENDLKRLLTLLLTQGTKHKNLVIKCASKLSSTSLASMLANYLYEENLHWKENISEQLVLTFNRIHNLNEEILKTCLLLMLQNPWEFYRHLFSIAFKRSTEIFKIFALVKDLSVETGLSAKALWAVIDLNPPTTQNVANYVQLFQTLLDSGFLNWNYTVTKVFLPLLDKLDSSAQLEQFNDCLNILKHFKDQKCDLPTEVQLFEYLLTTASKHRSKSFLDFNVVKNEITTHCVDCILHKCHSYQNLQGKRESFPDLATNLNDPWSNYYKNMFWENHCCFVDFIIPGLNLSDYKEGEMDEHFTALLKILPRCVASEWTILLKEILEKNSFSTVSTVLTYISILLCDFGGSGAHLEPLKFCLRNYATILLWTPNSKSDQLLAASNLCRVLKHVPNPLKATEGLLLINAVPEVVFKALSDDKEFVGRIVSINDKQLCQAFAQKILAAAQQGKN